MLLFSFYAIFSVFNFCFFDKKSNKPMWVKYNKDDYAKLKIVNIFWVGGLIANFFQGASYKFTNIEKFFKSIDLNYYWTQYVFSFAFPHIKIPHITNVLE